MVPQSRKRAATVPPNVLIAAREARRGRRSFQAREKRAQRSFFLVGGLHFRCRDFTDGPRVVEFSREIYALATQAAPLRGWPLFD